MEREPALRARLHRDRKTPGSIFPATQVAPPSVEYPMAAWRTPVPYRPGMRAIAS